MITAREEDLSVLQMRSATTAGFAMGAKLASLASAYLDPNPAQLRDPHVMKVQTAALLQAHLVPIIAIATMAGSVTDAKVAFLVSVETDHVHACRLRAYAMNHKIVA